MKTPPIVSAQEWEAALDAMLVKEKEFTHARDALAAMRRRMPWTPVEKAYEFEGPEGTLSMLDLFQGRRQLIVYRAFVDPGVRCRRSAISVSVSGSCSARMSRMAFSAPYPRARWRRSS